MIGNLANTASPNILSLLEKLDGCKHLPILNLLGYTLLLKPKQYLIKKMEMLNKLLQGSIIFGTY
jgi:hypothetical protein